MKPREEMNRCKIARQVNDTIADNLRNVATCNQDEKIKALKKLADANRLISEVEFFIKNMHEGNK